MTEQPGYKPLSREELNAMAGEECGWALPVDDQLVHEVLA